MVDSPMSVTHIERMILSTGSPHEVHINAHGRGKEEQGDEHPCPPIAKVQRPARPHSVFYDKSRVARVAIDEAPLPTVVRSPVLSYGFFRRCEAASTLSEINREASCDATND